MVQCGIFSRDVGYREFRRPPVERGSLNIGSPKTASVNCVPTEAGRRSTLAVHTGFGRVFISDVERGKKEPCLRSNRIKARARPRIWMPGHEGRSAPHLVLSARARANRQALPTWQLGEDGEQKRRI